MAQNSGTAAGSPRSKHANGSVLCDKWYRHGKCSRSDCGFAHRDALPGKDIVPPCNDFFTLKDRCSRGTNCKLLHNKGSALVPTKNAPKVSGRSRGSGIGGNSSLAPERPIFVLPGMPKAREDDKPSSTAKPKAVPNPPGRSSSGEGDAIAFHAKNSRRENGRGSHLAQERSTAIKRDGKASAVNTPRPPPKLPTAYSDHVQNIAHSKERDDWRNRRSLLTTHGARTVPREAKVELSQLEDDAGDSKNDGGVSLEILGPKTSVANAPPPSFHTSKRKADVAVVVNTLNTTRINNKTRSISVEAPKTACRAKPDPRNDSDHGNSSGGGCSSRSPSVPTPPTAYHERVTASDATHLIEESQTISGGIEPKPPVSNSLKRFLKTPCTENFGCNIEEDELFQISSGGVRLLDRFARQYASDPDAIQEKYGHLCFLLQADPRRDFSQLRYIAETHRSMFWQLDPVRLRGVDSRKIKPEASPEDEIHGDSTRKTPTGISISDQDGSGWDPRDVPQNPHYRYNRSARTTSEYNVSTVRAPPHLVDVAPKERGGGYPSKNQLNHNDGACTILGDRRGACSGNRYNSQPQAVQADVDRMSLGKKGSAFSDHSGVTTMVSARTITGTDRAVTVESLGLTTLKHEGSLSKNNATFHPKARASEHANGEFSTSSEESETPLEPVVKKQVAEEAYTPCETLDVRRPMILLSTDDPAPSIGSGPSSLAPSPLDSSAPPLIVKRQSTGPNDEESLAVRKTADCTQAGAPQKSEKPLGPPSGSQMPCFTSRDEAKMALAVSLQKPGQFATKGEPGPQQSDLEAQEDLPWMNESDSGNETPSAWEWDWDKKSSQTGLTDDEWNAGVPLHQISIESFDGVVENKTGSPVSPVERVFELPEDPGSFPNLRKETRKRHCTKKYRAKESKESPRASEGKNYESLKSANGPNESQTPGNNIVKQPIPEYKAGNRPAPEHNASGPPVLEHNASEPSVLENKARKPPASHRKVNRPLMSVNRASEPIMSEGVNDKLMASEGHNKSSPRPRNNGGANESISRGRSLGGSGGITKLPEEVLYAAFSYAADGVLPEVQVKTKDLTYGYGFEAPSNFNKTQYKGLWSVLRTCRRWRALGQEILYKYVNLSDWSNLELFARTVSQNQNLGALVRSLRISVRPFSLQSSYQSYNNRDRNSRIAFVEQADASRLLPDIMHGCSLIHVMSIDMPNTVLAFNKLVSMQKFPNLREIRMKDGGERIATGERVWENIIRNAPELKKLVITQDQDLSLRNAPTVIKIPENIFHSEKASTFKLTQIRLTRSYEITDNILLLLCGKLSSLNDLDIVDCPLVTSRGIAQMLEKMPNRLTRLTFFIWINHYGNVSKREQEIGVDLCHALRKHGQSLQHMDIKIFLACHHLWQDGFRELQRCRIVPFHYHDCVKQQNVRSSAFFKNVLAEGRNAGKFPALTDIRV